MFYLIIVSKKLHVFFASLSGCTIAEKEVPDSEQCVEGQVTCEETHQPVGGKHEGLHSVVLQVFVCSRTRPFQDPGQHGRIKQDSFLQRYTGLDRAGKQRSQ